MIPGTRAGLADVPALTLPVLGLLGAHDPLEEPMAIPASILAIDREAFSTPAYDYLPDDIPVPRCNATARLRNDETKVPIKWFGGGAFSYYLVGYDPDGPDAGQVFGYMTGVPFPELGYADLGELIALRFRPFGLPMERDEHWDPDTLLSDVIEGKIR